MAQTASDAELATEARGGSEAAYRELVSRYATPSVNFIYRYVGDRALAEDLAQEGFLRVYQRLDTYDTGRKFSSWFFQVLRNITIDYLRVNRLPTSSLDELEQDGRPTRAIDGESVSPEDAAQQTELARAMNAALVLVVTGAVIALADAPQIANSLVKGAALTSSRLLPWLVAYATVAMDSWWTLARVGGVIASALVTPGRAIAILGSELVGLLAFYALHRVAGARRLGDAQL